LSYYVIFGSCEILINLNFASLFDLVLLLSLLASTDAALPFKKVSIAKTPASTSSTTSTTTESAAGEEEEVEEEQPVPSGDGGDTSKVR